MKIKRIISRVLAFVIAFFAMPAISNASQTVETKLYADDFEEYTINSRPDDIDVYGDKSSIYVDSVVSSKRLWLKNQSEIKRVEISKTFSKVSEKQVVFELDFLQLYNTSEGDTVLGIYSGEIPVVLIETNDGNISYKEDNVYMPIVEDYAYNKIYSIKVELDLYAKTAEVYIKDRRVGTYGLLDSSGTADSIKMKAEKSPGFTIDNIKIYMEETVDAVEISGDNKPVIPVYDSAEYTYSAIVKDFNGAKVTNADVEWSLTGAPDGAVLTENADGTAKLIIESGSGSQNFGIKAIVKGTSIYDILEVETEETSASGVEILGWTDKVNLYNNDGEAYSVSYPSYRITGDDKEVKQYKFKTIVSDQFGNEVENYGRFNWSLYSPEGEPDVPDYVSINSRTGVITVSKNPETEQKIGVKAVSEDNTSVFGKTEISLLELDTYVTDKMRFDAVVSHVESVLDSASLDGTPLIADLFHRQGRSPIWVAYEEGDVITSNVMAQSGLLRTMYNLTEITQNNKYRDRVNDIYSYMMSDGILTDGITMAWGGHMSMNMEKETPSGTTSIHEIKSIAPFLAPMFAEDVNTEYMDDTYNNGNGWAGILCRAMISGHMMGDYKNLAFERHWYEGQTAYAFEPIWQTPEVFDSERRGPAQREGGASFASAGTRFVAFLIEYYKQTGDTNALQWADNLVMSVQNSEYTYYVYKDPQGNYIWPSDTTGDINRDGVADSGDFKREFYNKNNELVYTSVKKDSVVMYGKDVANAVYEHRDIAEIDENGNVTDIVKAIDKDGNEVDLTLYNTWSEGLFADMATTKGAEHKARAYSGNLGYEWYLEPGIKNGGKGATGPEYGDRLYGNWILGTYDPDDKDTWVEQGLCTEEEGELMLEPYQQTREVFCLEWAQVYCELIETYIEAENYDRAVELAERYSKSIYNMLKLRWDSGEDKFLSYMSWIRPEYMRRNEIVGYEEIGVGEDYQRYDQNNVNSRYFRTTDTMLAPHNGYYYNKGEKFSSKALEIQYAGGIMTLCATMRDVIEELEKTEQSDPDYADNTAKAELLRNRVEYMWKVLREMCTDKIPIGDIGEDMFNVDPELDLYSTANSTKMVENLMYMYRATNHYDFLKLARNVANNVVRNQYSTGERVFRNDSNYFVASSNDILAILLQLDALLLDRYNENIKYDTSRPGENFYDTEIYLENGAFDGVNSLMTSPSVIWANRSVKVKKINILHDVIELKAGESIKINYEVKPYDAESKDVTWDVYDQRVAMMDTDTQTLYALKKGKTKIRCVSTSRTGIESKEVEVIVK